jgi:hypothetical protein
MKTPTDNDFRAVAVLKFKATNAVQEYAEALSALLGQTSEAGLIEDALRKANETKIETNSLVRWKVAVLKQNAQMDNIDKFGIEGVSIDGERLKIKLPTFLKDTSESTAAIRNCRGLDLEVK